MSCWIFNCSDNLCEQFDKYGYPFTQNADALQDNVRNIAKTIVLKNSRFGSGKHFKIFKNFNENPNLIILFK